MGLDIGGMMKDVGELCIDAAGIALAPYTGGASLVAASEINKSLGGGDDSSFGGITNTANSFTGLAGEAEGV